MTLPVDPGGDAAPGEPVPSSDDGAADRDGVEPPGTRPGGGRDTLGLLLSNRVALAAAIVLGALVVAAVLGSVLVDDPNAQSTDRLVGPSLDHPFGTDNLGRDVLARVVLAARVSLLVGAVAVGISLTAGVVIGTLAGFYRRWVDDVLMRTMDVLFSFPAILLAIAIVAVLGRSTTNAMIAIGLVYTPIFARVARAGTLSVANSTHVRAVRSLGAGDVRLLTRHVLPNMLGPLIVQTSLSFAFAILSEAALSFLGLGTRPPDPSWGRMLFESRDFMEQAPWTALAPGLAIMVVVLACNLLGDALRDVLDPRQRGALEVRRLDR